MFNPELVSSVLESSMLVGPVVFGAVLIKLEASQKVSKFYENYAIGKTRSKLYEDPQHNTYVFVPDGGTTSFEIQDHGSKLLCVVEDIAEVQKANIFIGSTPTFFDEHEVNIAMKVNGLSTGRAKYISLGREIGIALDRLIIEKQLIDVTPPPVIRKKRTKKLK